MINCYHQSVIKAFLPLCDHPEKEAIASFVKRFLKKRDYLQVLWSNYTSLCSTPIPDNMSSYEEMNLWVENTLHEEYTLLKSIFLLCRFQTVAADLNFQMLEVFYNQSFQGSFQSHSNQKNLKIQEFYQSQLKLAQNIADLCILIILASFSLDNVDSSTSPKDVNSSIAPFNHILKSGGKLFAFFDKAKDLQELSVIFIAFRSLVLLFNLMAKSSKSSENLKNLYEYDLNQLIKFEKVGYLSFVREMFLHDLLKDNSDFSLGLEYRLVIKSWISVLSVTLNDSDLIQNFDLYAEIMSLCLNEPAMVTLYWEEDVKLNKDLAIFVNRMMNFFPLKCSKFLKLLSTLVSRNKYSAGNIIKILGEMVVFCSEAREIEYETVFSSLHEGHSGEVFKSLEDQVINDFRIPKGTQYRLINRTIDNEDIPLVFQWFMEYNYWNRVFSEWTLTINRLCDKPLENIDLGLLSSIKLICKALTMDPKVLYMLEQYLTHYKVKSNVYPAGITVILLLIDSLFYFQRLKSPPYSLFSQIIAAINSLMANEEKHYRRLLCFMIQIHPLSVFTYEKNRSDMIEHPFFEVLALIKRNDNTVEYNGKKYDLMLQILNFCCEIFKNNEYPLELFPDENQIKLSYFFGPGNSEQKIQELALRIQDLHQTESEWSFEDVELINRQIESLINFPLKSSFMEDMFKIVYEYILPNYDRFLFLPNEIGKKFQIGTYLFKITGLLLNKFSVNMDRINIFFTHNIENPLLKLIARHLNATNFQDFLLKTLEVHAILDQMEIPEDREASSCLENKNWTVYIQNSQNDLDFQLRSAFRNMLASCLSTFETIIGLTQIYEESKGIHRTDLPSSIENEVNSLELIDFFYKIFSSKEEMFCYQQTYFTQNSSKQIAINLVLAITSLLNFENFKDLMVSNDTLTLFEGGLPLPPSEMEMESNQNFLYNADFSLGPNILLNGRAKTNLFQDSLTTLSLRVLSKLIVFWESLPAGKKLLLNEFLISVPLQSETGTSFSYVVYREMMKILFNHGEQTDDAIMVLEMLIICLHSQKSFIDPFLKDTSVLSNLPNRMKLNDHFIDFCEKVVREREPQKLNKQFLGHFLLLICEIFKKEDTCRSFVSRLRSTPSFFSDLTNTIFTSLKPDSSFLKSVNELFSLSGNLPIEQQLKSPQIQFNRLRMENEVMTLIINNFMILTVLQLISNEILKQPKNVAIVLTQNFNKQFMNWITFYSFNKSRKIKPLFRTGLDYFLAELANVRNLNIPSNEERSNQYSRHDISSYRTIYLKSIQPRQRSHAIKDSQGVLPKGLFKLLNSNEFGYGKNFLFDSQELFFALKLCNYKPDFIYRFTIELQSYNLFNSIMDVDFKCLEGWVRLFDFIASLGEEGVASSTMIYDTFVPLSLKTMQELFKSPKEITIFNANSGFLVEKGGFISVFSENGAEPEERAWKFLKHVVKFLISEFGNDKFDYKKDDIYRRYLNQQINLLISSFSCLHYIVNKKSLEKSRVYSWELRDQTMGFAQSVLANILQYPQLSELNTTNFITFLFYFLSFSDCYEQTSGMFEEGQANRLLCESLYEFLKKNLDCYPLIAYSLIFLIRKNPGAYINYFSKEGRKIVEHILEKLSLADTTYQEWISNIKFMIELCQIEKGCTLLKELGLINELCQNVKLKESFEEYKEENRSSSHIIWCWVLVLYRVFAKGLVKSPGDISSALFFVKTYINRFERVLTMPLILSKDLKNSKLFSANLNLRVPTNMKFKYSLAFLEELDYTLQLLSVFFLDSRQWKEINKNLFDEVVLHLSICTIKLFKSNFSYTENFFPQTRYEKKLSEMIGGDRVAQPDNRVFKGIQPNDIVTSTATPMKMVINPKKDLNEPAKPSSKEIVTTLTQYYNPSLYIFKIELCYQNILLSLMFILTQAFPHSDLCQYFDEQVFVEPGNAAKHPKYDSYYWEYFAEAINDCQIYKRQTAQKWIAHEDGLKRALKKLEVVRNSVETGIHYGSLNTLEKIPDFDLMIKYSITALIMSFEVAALHFEMFLEYKKLWNVLISDIIKMFKEKTTHNIEESEKLLLKHISRYEEIPNFSIMNFSLEGSIDKRGLIESKSEMSENQKRISFMTCIKYHILNLKI